MGKAGTTLQTLVSKDVLIAGYHVGLDRQENQMKRRNKNEEIDS